LKNLEEAIIKQDLELVKQILILDPTCIDDKDGNGIPMSFVAARTGNLDIVKYIVEYSRASMNTVEDQNRNILHFAAMSGNVELSRYLIERVGMSAVSPDRDLVTPFDIAHSMRHRDLEQYYEEVCGAPLSGMYRNPIRTGMHPDPSVLRVGEDYYMVNSSFILFPCIPISHSRDLINWRIIGYAITNPEWASLDELEGGRGYWAPDISYYEERFYITATYRLNDTGTVYRRQIIVSSDKPEGPYSKPISIEEDGIDPSIFNDDDGRRYMLLNRGARILELNKTATRQISEARLLYYGDQKRAPEGPHLLKKDGYYYLFLAEGGTGPGHRITVARSKELYGKYEPCPYNPIMQQKDEKAGIQRCGHGKPVMTRNGEWFMVYLCGRMVEGKYSILGRETALDPITWTADGWPIVNNLDGPSALQVKPNLRECIWDNSDWDDFDSESLGLDWMFPRPPEADGYRLYAGKLWLKGSKAPLHLTTARNIVLRRQKHFVFTGETGMDLVAMKPGQDAGMICYYDENTWLKYAVFASPDGGMQLKVIEHIGLEDMEHNSNFPVRLDAGAKTIYLRISTKYLQREFFYSYNGLDFMPFTVLNNVYYLCDEGIQMGKRFTGALVGLYAYGGGDGLEVPYEYFHYKGESNYMSEMST
jgi:xylan 1,4-beta-xylosidase